MKYTDKQLLDKVKSLDSFTHWPDALLIGVASKADAPDMFDDKAYGYRKPVPPMAPALPMEFGFAATCTTHSGVPALTGGWRKYSKLGAAMIRRNKIFYDVYRKSDGSAEYRHHNGRMQCLRQVKELEYTRDNDNDKKAEAYGPITKGNNATNVHFSNYNLWSRIVKKFIRGWSYGCVVLNQSKQYRKMLSFFGWRFVSIVILDEF